MPYCYYHQKEEEKLCKSHIIPKCFFDKSDNYVAVISDGTIDGRHYQNGIKDCNILCAEADNLFNPFDDEASRVLIKNMEYYRVLETYPKSATYALYPSGHFDYQKMRHFIISLAWRASISKIEEFKNFSLGKLEDTALEILQGKTPDNPNFCNAIIIKKESDGMIFSKTIHIKTTQGILFSLSDFYIIIIPQSTPYLDKFNSITPEHLAIYKTSKTAPIITQTINETLSQHFTNNAKLKGA